MLFYSVVLCCSVLYECECVFDSNTASSLARLNVLASAKLTTTTTTLTIIYSVVELEIHLIITIIVNIYYSTYTYHFYWRATNFSIEEPRQGEDIIAIQVKEETRRLVD